MLFTTWVSNLVSQPRPGEAVSWMVDPVHLLKKNHMYTSGFKDHLYSNDAQIVSLARSDYKSKYLLDLFSCYPISTSNSPYPPREDFLSSPWSINLALGDWFCLSPGTHLWPFALLSSWPSCSLCCFCFLHFSLICRLLLTPLSHLSSCPEPVLPGLPAELLTSLPASSLFALLSLLFQRDIYKEKIKVLYLKSSNDTSSYQG